MPDLTARTPSPNNSTVLSTTELQHAIDAMIERGVPCPPTPPRTYRRALEALARWLEEPTHTLPTHGPWKLSHRVASRLTRELGLTPPGGWARFIELLAGTEAMVRPNTSSCFEPTPQLVEEARREDAAIATHLLEAMTHHLIPPTVCASLGIGLGLGPAYVLRAARDIIHGERVRCAPHEEILLGAMARALGGLLEALAQCPPDHAHALDDLARVWVTILGEVHARMRRELEPHAASCPGILLPRKLHSRAMSHAAQREELSSYLLPAWLIPAGVLAPLDERRFVVIEGSIPRGHEVLARYRLGDHAQGEGPLTPAR